MQVIYLDVLAALNFGMDYGILRATEQISGRHSTLRRMVLASAVGACYACLSVLVPRLACLPLRLLSMAVMTRMAFVCVSRAIWTRMTLTVWLMSMVFGGCVCGLGALCGGTFYRSGVLTVPVSRGVLLSAAVLSYLLSGVLFRREASADAPKRERVTIRACGETAEVLLLRDSGNCLTDPSSGKPVLILTRQTAEALFPKAVMGAEKGKIAYCTLSGEGVLDSFVPEEIRRESGARYEAVVALTDRVLGADCDGLIAD